MIEKQAAHPPIPPDDPARTLTIAQPDTDESLPHIGLVGDTYTILLAGKDTAGRFCLIDMLIPPGGGPPPHRHDFEETFILLEGEVEATFRGENSRPRRNDDSYSRQRPPSVSERILCTRAPALHLLAGRAGGVLRAGRYTGSQSHVAATSVDSGRTGRLHEESSGARP